MSDSYMELRKQPEITDLFEALEESGLEKEKGQVSTLVDYIEGMESRLAEVLDELKEVRGQLIKIEDKGIRSAAVHIAEGVENKVKEIASHLTQLKQSLIRSARHAVDTFKEKGTGALKKAVSAMKIPAALSAMKPLLANAKESMNRHAAKMDAISGEIHEIGGHTKNIGRVILGRQTREAEEKDTDKGILGKAKAAFLSFGKSFEHMEQTTEHAAKRMEEFTKDVEKKPSVREQLRQIKSQKSGTQTVQPLAKETAR